MATTSATGLSTSRRAPRGAGFTLLEMLVVLVLIGIIISFVRLSIGDDGRSAELQRETRRLEALVTLASQQAVMRSQEYAVRFAADGYRFMVWGDDGKWHVLKDDMVLRPRTLPAGMHVRLALEGHAPKLQAQASPPADGAAAAGGTTDTDGAGTAAGSGSTDGTMSDSAPAPMIYLMSSGEITPFTVTLWVDQSRVRYHLTGTLFGRLEWQAGQDG